MNRRISLVLGSHAHLPYGTGDDEFERAFWTQLKPFISTLYRYPGVQAVLHYSGVLLHWIERNHPEFFVLIEELVSRKQVELLGGGFYEPMMSIIPASDRISQIEMLTTYLRKQFGKRPQGCWLPGLVWEQSMVGTLHASGMTYTFLDEGQFTALGLSPLAPVISEDQGKIISVFPILSRFHERLGGENPSRILEEIRNQVPPGGIVSVFPDHFFAEDDSNARLSRFFEDLSREESIEFTAPARLLKNIRDLTKAYFPPSGICCEDPAVNPAGTPAGISAGAAGVPAMMPRQFLIAYPEANGIYSKMIFTHGLINQLRGDKSRKRAAREELLKAQGYDVFCHLGNGGIYRSALRKAVYRALLGAEKITRDKGEFIPSLLAYDINLDGKEEYLFQEHTINCYVGTRGAGVFELDYLPKTWNYLDTLSRRREPYAGPAKGGDEDGYQRGAFLDRLAPREFSLAHVLEGRFAGSRFCGVERYEAVSMDRFQEKAQFRLPPRDGVPFGRLSLEKTYHLKKDVLTVRYNFTNTGAVAEAFKFIPEIDLSFPGEGESFLRILKQRNGAKEPAGGNSGKTKFPGTAELSGVEGVELQDIKNETVIGLTPDRPCDIWIRPVKTLCRIGGVIAEHYQAVCVMPVHEAALEPGGSWETAFKLRIQH
jgi:hypothetical protein